MMKAALLNIFTLILLTAAAWTQNYDPERVLVKIEPGVSRGEFDAVLNKADYEIEKVLVRRLGIVSVRIKNRNISAADGLSAMRSNPWVEKAQLDHEVVLRDSFPDDIDFNSLWGLHNTGQSGGLADADIDAPEAWDITTGGVTPLGDTIVVAVIDGGCELTHDDLVDNIWVNRNEIAGNMIDDDNNGYIDDVNGWDAYASDGTIPTNNHGTHVAGIIGARGNNSSQVAGVNWAVKIMPIGGSSGTTSLVLEAYGYALDQRVLYDSTEGAYGAFVVATNSSFGVNYGDCSSPTYSLWNDVYNAMGEAGILSAGATMNINADVDVSGDIPTACDSDYLISVTNTTRYDARNSSAAYGATTIDIGAPGTNILSTTLGNSTGNLTGTSMATPHVAGAIGFLHAAMTGGFASYYKENPAEGALLLKDFILAGADSIPALDGITVTGGRLNIHNSAQMLQGFMAGDSLDPNPVSDLTTNTNIWYEVTLTWADPVTRMNGDSLDAYVIEISRDGDSLTTVQPDSQYFNDGVFPGGQVLTYELITRDIDSDSTSMPVSVTVTIEGDEFIPGDTNHDGTVNVADIIKILHFTLGYDSPTLIDVMTADMDHNETIDINDLLIIVDTILGRI